MKWFRTNGRVAAQSSQSSNSEALELLFLDVSCSFKFDRCKAPGSQLCLLPASASHGIQGEWHSDKSNMSKSYGKMPRRSKCWLLLRFSRFKYHHIILYIIHKIISYHDIYIIYIIYIIPSYKSSTSQFLNLRLQQHAPQWPDRNPWDQL